MDPSLRLTGLALAAVALAACLPAPTAGPLDTGSDDVEDTGCEDPATWYRDADGDGFGDPLSSLQACEEPEGTVSNSDDCDDDNAGASPSEVETCDDSFDNDCDGIASHCGPAGTYEVNEAATAVFVSTHDNSKLGISLDVANIDGSGAPMLMLSAHKEERVYGFRGPLRASQADEEADLVISYSGGDGSSDFGLAVVGLGPQGGLAVSAPQDDSRYEDGGAVFLFGLGDEAEWDTAAAQGVVLGSDPAQLAGFAMANLGDFDGAGGADVLIGTLTQGKVAAVGVVDSEQVGPVFLEDLEVYWTGSSEAHAGSAVAAAGDLNGDGLDDAVVGAYQAGTTALVHAGAFYIGLGPGTGFTDLEDADQVVEGTQVEEQLGIQVAGIGDTDGDGYGEVAVTAGGLAQVRIIRGLDDEANLDLMGTISHTDLGILFGNRIASAGDIDGDGVVDLLVAAPYAPDSVSQAGAVYLLYGPHEGIIDVETEAGAVFESSQAGGSLGLGLTGIGDVDGDGGDDFLVGAPRVETDLGGKGLVWLISSSLE